MKPGLRNLLITVALSFDIHAIYHLADVLLQADGVFLHLSKRSVEVVNQNPPLAHIEVDSLTTNLFCLTVISAHLSVVPREVSTLLGRAGTLGSNQANIHRLSFDSLDQTFC